MKHVVARGKKRSHPILFFDSYDLETPAPQAAQPDRNLLATELQDAIDEAIQVLPPPQRLALILRRYENLRL